MAKFVFKLQSLLNVKLQQEDSLKNDLGKAVQRLEHEKNRLLELENESEECINHITTRSSRGIAVGELRQYSEYISLLKERMTIQKENINYAQNNVDIYRERLIKAVQERQMLEKLREKKYQEYLKESLKDEQRLNDEIASYNYNQTLTGDNDG